MATLTVYPEASPATTACDGVVVYFYNVGGGVSWSTIHNASAGTNVGGGSGANITNNNQTTIEIRNQLGDGPNAWIIMGRGAVLFDTSALTSAANISGATLSLNCDSHSQFGFSMSHNIVSATPASNTTLVNDDYDQFGTTEFSTAVNVSSISDGSYTDFTLNASGISNISKTGVSKFGIRTVNDLSNSEPGTRAANYYSIVSWRSADYTGTSSDPKLVITYTAATNTGRFFAMF